MSSTQCLQCFNVSILFVNNIYIYIYTYIYIYIYIHIYAVIFMKARKFLVGRSRQESFKATAGNLD